MPSTNCWAQTSNGFSAELSPSSNSSLPLARLHQITVATTKSARPPPASSATCCSPWDSQSPSCSSDRRGGRAGQGASSSTRSEASKAGSMGSRRGEAYVWISRACRIVLLPPDDVRVTQQRMILQAATAQSHTAARDPIRREQMRRQLVDADGLVLRHGGNKRSRRLQTVQQPSAQRRACRQEFRRRPLRRGDRSQGKPDHLAAIELLALADGHEELEKPFSAGLHGQL